MKRGKTVNFVKMSFIIVIVFIAAGCFGRSKAPHLVEQYSLEYTPPTVESLGRMCEPIKVERFSVYQSFNSQAMLYRAQPYKLAAYNYNRWRVNPGDMVTDYLIRDLRAANVFPVVFSYRDIEGTRFIIEGGVEEFLEMMAQDNRKAVLKTNVSFIDGSQKELTKRVVFQKRYHFEESLKEHSPDEFARGMSVNMLHFSEQLIKDIHGVAGKN
ncbi:MAG: ABC-type transport auxiliary lipoprotein family protein [Proteobacteria bacterium]|nr:ABC-type transport auxiliary lipoprotein family protein [Pseudomonadota bacterium]